MPKVVQELMRQYTLRIPARIFDEMPKNADRADQIRARIDVGGQLEGLAELVERQAEMIQAQGEQIAALSGQISKVQRDRAQLIEQLKGLRSQHAAIAAEVNGVAQQGATCEKAMMAAIASLRDGLSGATISGKAGWGDLSGTVRLKPRTKKAAGKTKPAGASAGGE